MAFHCMNCNGSMVFDIKLQRMRCEHCGSTCAPGDFVFRDSSPEADGHAFVADGYMASFTCQNCGAELEGTEDSLIGFCPYCGGQSMVRREGSESKVETLVPFRVTKDQCMEQYRSFARKVPYLPREFKDPTYIQKFTGIYMPFHQFDAEFGEVKLKGTKTVEHNSRYDVVNTYSIEGIVKEDYERGVTFDASKYLDDELAEDIQPFGTAHEWPFKPAYLAGFYADASTVDAEVYRDDARARAEQDLVQAFGTEINRDLGIAVSGDSTAETTITGNHLALMPMWFLTWRKDDRVAYAVINGETGKVKSDLPLDRRAFGIGCAAVSLAIFVLLELLVQPTPFITSLISLVAALLMAIGIRMGAKREYVREVHANDKGWGEEQPEAGGKKAKKEKKQRKPIEMTFNGKQVGPGKLYTVLLSIPMLFSIAMLCMVAFAVLDSLPFFRYLLPLPVLIYAITVLVRISKWKKVVKSNYAFLAIILLIVTIVINTAVVGISPVNDGWYYIGDAVCIAGLVASALFMIQTYNESTTRPVPKLFDRAEVH